MHVVFVSTTQHGHLNPAIPMMRELLSRSCTVSCLLLSADGGEISAKQLAALEPIKINIIGKVDMAPWSGPPEGVREFLEQTTIADDTAAAIKALNPDFVLVDSFPVTVPAVVGVHLSGAPYGLTSANLGPVTPRDFRSMRWEYDAITGEYLRSHGVGWCAQSHSPRSPFLNIAPGIPAMFGDQAILDSVKLAGLPGANGVRGDELPFTERERIDTSRPLIYVSFGTIFYRRPELLRQVLEATLDLDVNVVASVGELGEEFADLADRIILAPYVPQREILEQASVFVTHGGFNSVAESIRSATPMLVLPLAIDQPVQAHYVAKVGFGISIKPADASMDGIHSALRELLSDDKYQSRLDSIKDSCGDSAAMTAQLVIEAIQNV